MIDQLESELRHAFAERASDVGADAVARLSRHDYRPRSTRVRPPVAAGALAVSAGAAAALIWVVGLGAGTSNAFAGWSPSPTAATSDQAVRARATCEAQLVGHATTAKPILTDTRGPFTVTLYPNSGSTATCISGPSFTSVSGAKAASGYAYGDSRGLQFEGAHLTTRDGHAYTLAAGRAPGDVKAAAFVLDDGSRVTATVENGWYAAWWPGTHEAVRVDVTTPAGTKEQTLRTGGPGCTGPGKCTVSGAGERQAGSGAPAAGVHTGP